MNLILISRTDPPLPLTRFRVRNQLTELREGDLRFTAEEAATFLNQVMQLDLTFEDIHALESRTEGWIAGLQLAALSMQGRGDVRSFVEAFTGSHRYVIDYLAEEVLAQQPEEIRDFLIRTSILERLSGPLCDALLARSENDQSPNYQLPITNYSSQTTLEHLDQANLFLIPLDDERRWYRYHHLFADFLREQLHKTLSSEAIAHLHQRAGNWYLGQEMVAEAVQHALAAQNFEQAAQLIERLSMTMLTQGEVVSLLNWLEGFPPSFITERPRLSLSLAWAYLILNRFDDIEPALKNAEQKLRNEATDDLLTDYRTSISEMKLEVDTIRSMLMGAQGQVPEAIDLAEQALSHLTKDDVVGEGILKMHLGNLYENMGDFNRAGTSLAEALTLAQSSDNSIIVFTAGNALADLYMDHGQLPQAAQLQRELLAYFNNQADAIRQPGLISRAHLGLAEIAREQNDLALATSHLDTAFTVMHEGNSFMGSLQIGHLIRARLLHAQGNLGQALTVIAEAKQQVTVLYPTFHWVDAVQAQLRLATGDLAGATQWLESFRELVAEGLPYSEHPSEFGTLVRVYLVIEQFEAATDLLTRMTAEEEQLGRNGRLLEIFILQALAAQAQGDTDQALPWLEKALPLAEAGGYVRLFIDEGTPMASLLHKAARSSSVNTYAYTLLDAFSPPYTIESIPSPIENPKSKIQNLVEPLSERELEVLRLIADGLSNQEIADSLIIAEGTVKKHIHNIFGKLAVRRRTQVVLRARELGLL